MSAHRPLSPDAACPRCDYDLSGALATWATSCPTEGTCPECGLVFPWRDILDPHFAIPPWLFEHARSRRLSAFARTIIRALRPRTWWSSVRLTFVVRPVRLVIIALLPLLVAHAFIGLATLLTVSSYNLTFGVVSSTFLRVLPSWSYPLIFPYALSSIFELPLLGTSPWMYLSLLWFALAPLTFMAIPATLRRCRVRRRHLVRIFAYSLLGLPLVLLPSLLFADGSILGYRGWASWGNNLPPYRLLTANFASLPLLTGLWLGATWWAAATRYLRLPHAVAVVAVLLFCSFLASLVIVATLHPNFGFDPVTYWLTE